MPGALIGWMKVIVQELCALVVESLNEKGQEANWVMIDDGNKYRCVDGYIRSV